MAELACIAERYVGTQSGGMDQAISVMGQRGLAKVVHFNPVRTDDVKLPDGAVFVIANSLTVSNKAETAHTRYNLRVVECRLAAMLMAKRLGKPVGEALKFKTLGEVEKIIGGLEARRAARARRHNPSPLQTKRCAGRVLQRAQRKWHPASACDAALESAVPSTPTPIFPQESSAEAEKHLKPGCCSAAELEEEFGVKLTDLFSDNATSISVRLCLHQIQCRHYHSQRCLLRSARRWPAIEAGALRRCAQVLEHCKGGFKLHDRAVHVFGEAGRVTRFAAACAKGASLEDLGALMDASHASCRDLYECSCDELEELIGLAKASGAVGARLTGAGWGGCAVMLLPAAQAGGFVEAMKEKFFATRVASGASPLWSDAALLFLLLASHPFRISALSTTSGLTSVCDSSRALSLGIVKKEDLAECIFATEPGAGAAIFKL